VFVSVAVPVPFLDALTYQVPSESGRPARGARVLVPLGTRQVTGCVIDPEAAPPAEGVECREIVKVFDDEPFVPGHVLDLALWVAEYYAAGPGEAIAAAMPPASWVESERHVLITPDGAALLEQGAIRLTEPEVRALQALASGDPLSLTRLAHRASLEAPALVVRALGRDGLVEIAHVLRGRSAPFRLVRVAALTAAGQEVAAAEARAGDRVEARLTARQREALLALRGVPDGLAAPALRERGIDAGVLTRLASRGLVTIRRERQERDPFQAGAAWAVDEASMPGARVLTPEQTAAFDRLSGPARAGGFHVCLLHGVTGSGKTELYLRLAGVVLETGRRVLVLVPEIALTPAVARVFRLTFGARVAVQHSGLSDGERHDQWHRIRRGDVDIVVGTRSAVFAPLDRLGLVIVDEEHDTSYKQEETPRYNGRDVAIVRARSAGALVVLGSATPALESFRNAEAGRYGLMTLERRVLDRPLAAVRVVNMREEMAEQGADVVLSSSLVDALGDRGARGEQGLLLLNRRGFAAAVLCRQCGATLECPNCSVSLTVHHGTKGPGRARCHYCNHSAAVPPACTTCAAPYLERIGFGTEKVEAEVRRLLPGIRVARVDRDTMQRRGAIQQVLQQFAAGTFDVIVGTQMIAKGHDFPAVTLVGVISADVGLGVPDFRAGERTFQLLTQVVGRAGRGDIAGEAIIQTFFPEHYSVQLACRQDYTAFYTKELAYRRAMRYPPFVGLVNVIVRAPTFTAVMNDAGDLAAAVRAATAGQTISVLGPAPAALGRLRGAYRAQLLLKGAQRGVMRSAVLDALADRPELRRRVTVDVDPLSML
jgi:primosomal protein N' (replication factor Y) (superfamily II helicase)